MAENNKQEDMGLDFEMFMTEDGAQLLSNEQLKELGKKLPKWNIKPPAKYTQSQKKDD